MTGYQILSPWNGKCALFRNTIIGPAWYTIRLDIHEIIRDEYHLYMKIEYVQNK